MILLDYRNENPVTLIENEFDGNGVIEIISGHIYQLPEGMEIPETQDDWWYVDQFKNDENFIPTYTRRKDLKEMRD